MKSTDYLKYYNHMSIPVIIMVTRAMNIIS